ncbi:MAG: CAP domain-containing protein [Rhizobium sp.]|nr:CAP domain-containing protein [Rhizobium sp.]
MRGILLIAVCTLLGGCVETGYRADPMPTGAIGPVNYSSFSQQTLVSINAYRGQHGLPPRRSHPVAETLAMQHSQRQAATGRLAHSDRVRRNAIARSAGLDGCGENVGTNHRSPQDVVRRWARSPNHNAIMLWPGLRYAGVARHGPYLTFLACR